MGSREPDGSSWRTAAADLYGDLRLVSMLDRLVRHSAGLLGAAASSISVVEVDRQRYGKVAETGISCRLGDTFALGEGVTGQVLDRRGPVVLASYVDVPTGHLPADHPARSGAVVAVPIWWRGDVIGANVVFAGDSRRFAAGEVDELEALTQVAAAGLVREVPRWGTRPGVPSPLTPREQEVLDLLGRGLSDRQLASSLAISPKTVEKHVGAVLRKTGAGSRTAAVLRALELGWLASARG